MKVSRCSQIAPADHQLLSTLYQAALGISLPEAQVPCEAEVFNQKSNSGGACLHIMKDVW